MRRLAPPRMLSAALAPGRRAGQAAASSLHRGRPKTPAGKRKPLHSRAYSRDFRKADFHRQRGTNQNEWDEINSKEIPSRHPEEVPDISSGFSVEQASSGGDAGWETLGDLGMEPKRNRDW
ncbi:G protein-regulated inducer of neurite outgrowth 1 isoform X2 [Paroedura picta]|uniref:G protein-regulated inducer of neurite outgrowth 1 isoform X2 n=1 Tax=Paroedura picta TaxID=143630 RepID=UPI0040564DC4